MKTITIALNKGGTGKTTTASSLSAALRENGQKVLVIDTDPQGNLTNWYGAKKSSKTSYEVIMGKVKIDDAIQHTEKMDVIASSPLLAQLDAELSKEPAREYLMKEAIEGMKAKYDYVIIDTPPAVSVQLSNALTCSDGLVITAQADILSLQGIDQLAATVKVIHKRTNKKLKIYGILISRYQPRISIEKLSLGYIEERAAELGTVVFNTKIRNCSALKEAVLVGEDIFTYAPKSNAAKDYQHFTEELMKITGGKVKDVKKKGKK